MYRACFVIIGVGGYVARRHLEAIKSIGGVVVAALDKHDSVGILDSFFPDCDFFTEFEVFDRHVTMLQRTGTTIDYVVVCSPNYLHDAHCRFGLRIGADVICEKPLCLHSHNALALQEVEAETGRRIWNILQLRLHPVIMKLKEDIAKSDYNHKVDLSYVTCRGNWYDTSWKGDEFKSGGIAMNIGIHFFDMLLWVFGSVESNKVFGNTNKTMYGQIGLKKAQVDWILSIDKDNLPKDGNGRSYRRLRVDSENIDFTEGFEELHTKSYEEILAGRGFRIGHVLSAIELVNGINCSSRI